MARKSTFKTLLRRAGPPAALLIVIAFFGAYAVVGPNGALAYGDIKRQLAARKIELARLQQQRAVLRNNVALLDPRHADPDMVEELAHKQLNVVDPNDVIVPIN